MNFEQSNQQKIQSHLESLARSIPQDANIGIFMDFSECVIDTHLSRQVTNSYIDRIPADEVEQAKKDGDKVSGIRILMSCYIGLSKQDFMDRVRELATKSNLRPGFREFWSYIQENDIVAPFFVSSGLEIGIYEAMKSHNLKVLGSNIIADTIAYDTKETILGADMIVGGKEKMSVVEYFRDRKIFDRIVTIGHSSGDIELIKAGDEGFRLSFDDKTDLSKYSDHVIKDWDWDEVISFLK